MMALPNLSGLSTGMAIVVLLAFLSLMAFITLVRAWAPLKQLGMDESAQLREDRRADYRALKADFEALKVELDAVKVRTEAVERYGAAVNLRMGQLEFVFSLVMDELEIIAPENEVAKRARMMVSALYPIPPISPHIQDFIDAMKLQHPNAARGEAK